MDATGNTTQNISADKLYDMVQSDTLWPAERRVIYCSITGAPWGTVSEDYVRQCIKNFGWQQQGLENTIDRMTLFAGPSPMWQSKTSETLLRNQHADPRGFLVYLLNWSLGLERAAMEAKKNDLDTYIAWRKSMTVLYAELEKIDPEFIKKVNDTVLIMSGEGLLPQPHVFPAQELPPYAQREVLEKLMATCKRYYDIYRGRGHGKLFGLKKPQPRHEIHGRTFSRAYDADKMNEKQKFGMVELLMADLFREIDAGESQRSVKLAKQQTGIASPMFATLREIAQQQRDNPAPKTMQVLQKGQKIILNIKKKEV